MSSGLPQQTLLPPPTPVPFREGKWGCVGKAKINTRPMILAPRALAQEESFQSQVRGKKPIARHLGCPLVLSCF